MAREGHGTCQSWLRAAGAQRLKPPENDNRVTVCLPLGPSRGGWNFWPIYEEILENEPTTLAAIERTATATAHKLASGRRGRRRGAPPLHQRHRCLPRHREVTAQRNGVSPLLRCHSVLPAVAVSLSRPGSSARTGFGSGGFAGRCVSTQRPFLTATSSLSPSRKTRFSSQPLIWRRIFPRARVRGEFCARPS